MAAAPCAVLIWPRRSPIAARRTGRRSPLEWPKAPQAGERKRSGLSGLRAEPWGQPPSDFVQIWALSQRFLNGGLTNSADATIGFAEGRTLSWTQTAF